MQTLDTDQAFSEAEQTEIDTFLLIGAIDRARSLSYVFALAFLTYAFTSIGFVKKFAGVSLWDNLWPRIIFNTIPFILLGEFLRRSKCTEKSKILIWVTAMPVIFLSACLIHVWPSIISGHSQLYPYVHAANIFIVTVSMMAVSPPPRYYIINLIMFIVVFLVPLLVILYRTGDSLVFNLALNDFLFPLILATYLTHRTFKLRERIAQLDFQIKKDVQLFLGKKVTTAIHKRNVGSLEANGLLAFVINMDIRGFTKFAHRYGPESADAFLKEYHFLVSGIISKNGGYWHKTVGDFQLASFGAIEDDDRIDLSDIPGIESELIVAIKRRQAYLFKNALNSVMEIVEQFEQIKTKYDLSRSIGLGVSICWGPVDVQFRGDLTSRQELDISGEPMIRGARLEKFSKTIRDGLKTSASVIVLGPEIESLVQANPDFKVWGIFGVAGRVPDFPEINKLYYYLSI
jgi:class 3 adenylate cyclase